MDHIKIYIVEDSSIIRDNLTDALRESAPIEVVGCAEEERSAIAWLRDAGNECDLVIVDIFLKNGSGLGVLKAMGEIPGRAGAHRPQQSRHPGDPRQVPAARRDQGVRQVERARRDARLAQPLRAKRSRSCCVALLKTPRSLPTATKVAPIAR